MSPKKIKLITPVLVGWVFGAASMLATAEDGSWKFSTGLDYSSGKYGGDKDTDITYMPFSGSYQTGAWTAKVTVPWIRIDGPGGVVGGGDGVVVIRPKKDNGNGPTPTPTTNSTTTESGLGDIWASLKYEVQSFPADIGYLDFTAKIKIPTADEDDGLGTGETDYTLQADYAKSMGRLTPLLTVAYKIKGDPDDVDLDDVWYLSAGANWRVDSGLNVGASLDFQEASSDGADDALELFTYLSYKLSDLWSITPYVYFGFTDGSPDEGLGVSVNYKM